MENNENKKTPETLADEALDQVAGGGKKVYTRPQSNCPVCFQPKEKLAYYHDPADPKKRGYMCADCARDLGYV